MAVWVNDYLPDYPHMLNALTLAFLRTVETNTLTYRYAGTIEFTMPVMM